MKVTRHTETITTKHDRTSVEYCCEPMQKFIEAGGMDIERRKIRICGLDFLTGSDRYQPRDFEYPVMQCPFCGAPITEEDKRLGQDLL